MKVNLGRYLNSKKRKIDIKIDNFDTWSLDHTLSLIIFPALLQLKNTKQGIPSELNDSVGGDADNNLVFDFINEDADEVFDKACKKWDEIFDKIIWSFLQIGIEDDYDSQYHHGEIDIGWEKLPDSLYTNPVTGVKEPLYRVVDKNPDEHWYDSVGHRLHEERIQEGLDLFGKYFRNLWD